MNCYPCKDGGYIVLFAILDSLWPRVCEVIGREDLIEDERCNGMRVRADNSAFVDGVTAKWIARQDRDEAARLFQDAGVSVGPVLDHSEVAEFLQYREHESVVEIEHPRYGRLKTYGLAPKFSVTPAVVNSPAPDLGQHNEEVFGGIGLDAEQLAALREGGVI